MITTELEKKISFALMSMGFSPKTQGFAYIAECIVAFAQGDENFGDVEKRLSAARGVSVKNYASCMNKTFQSVSVSVMRDKINQIANYPLVTASTSMTVANFIGIMAEIARYGE